MLRISTIRNFLYGSITVLCIWRTRIGNVYDTQFSDVKNFFYVNKNNEQREKSLKNLFAYNIAEVWDNDKTLFLVKRTYAKTSMCVTRFSYQDGGAYIKALCGYMFENREPKKLKPPVDTYYDLAKLKLELSKVRIISGRKGGKAEKVKVTDEEISGTAHSTECGLTFDEFMRAHPNIKNDLCTSSRHLLNGVDWGYLDIGLERSEQYKNCTSLYAVLTHYKEIIAYAV